MIPSVYKFYPEEMFCIKDLKVVYLLAGCTDGAEVAEYLKRRQEKTSPQNQILTAALRGIIKFVVTHLFLVD